MTVASRKPSLSVCNERENDSAQSQPRNSNGEKESCNDSLYMKETEEKNLTTGSSEEEGQGEGEGRTSQPLKSRKCQSQAVSLKANGKGQKASYSVSHLEKQTQQKENNPRPSLQIAA